jgi:hypothetical protein
LSTACVGDSDGGAGAGGVGKDDCDGPACPLTARLGSNRDQHGLYETEIFVYDVTYLLALTMALESAKRSCVERMEAFVGVD